MAYAKRLTKTELMLEGITEITKEGRIFKGAKEIFPRWMPNRTTGDYLVLDFAERDSEGHLIKGKDRVYKYTRKDGSIREYTSWQAKQKVIGLHRVLWAWFHDEVPEGYVVDHINNKHSRIEDYHIDNLQLLTPKENVTKERICNVKEIPCKLDKPRSYYEDKLTKYEVLYEAAKKNKDANEAAKQRVNLGNTRARLRYYDAHIDEANNLIEFKKDCMELAAWKKVFKENKNKKLWKQCCTIEKIVKEKGIEARPVVQHALEVIHNTFGRN